MNLPILSRPAPLGGRGARRHAEAGKLAPSAGDPRALCQMCCATDPSMCSAVEGCSCPLGRG